MSGSRVHIFYFTVIWLILIQNKTTQLQDLGFKIIIYIEAGTGKITLHRTHNSYTQELTRTKFKNLRSWRSSDREDDFTSHVRVQLFPLKRLRITDAWSSHSNKGVPQTHSNKRVIQRDRQGKKKPNKTEEKRSGWRGGKNHRIICTAFVKIHLVMILRNHEHLSSFESTELQLHQDFCTVLVSS